MFWGSFGLGSVPICYAATSAIMNLVRNVKVVKPGTIDKSFLIPFNLFYLY